MRSGDGRLIDSINLLGYRQVAVRGIEAVDELISEWA